jgi:hypothetical protein
VIFELARPSARLAVSTAFQAVRPSASHSRRLETPMHVTCESERPCAQARTSICQEMHSGAALGYHRCLATGKSQLNRIMHCWVELPPLFGYKKRFDNLHSQSEKGSKHRLSTENSINRLVRAGGPIRFCTDISICFLRR